MDKIEKFFRKMRKKERRFFYKIFNDISALDLKSYDVKPLKGYKNLFRLRKGDVRVLFVKEGQKGIVVDIAYRKDIYK